MSTEGVRNLTVDDIKLVQNLIEHCLQLYMSRKETIDTLSTKAKIEPGFTDIVWKKLEEENPEFFKQYHIRLILKDQIVLYNQLLEKQVEYMKQLSNGPTPVDVSNGSHNPLLTQNSACHGQENKGSTMQEGDMHQPLTSSLYSNGGSSSVYMPGTVEPSSNMLMTKSSNMGLVQGINEQMMEPDIGYINGPPGMFNSNGNVVDACHAAVEMPVSSFNTVEPESQPINNNIPLGADADYESMEKSLERISKSFSLSDLTADFALTSDILESFTGSPFLEAGSDSFLDPQFQVQQQDDGILDMAIEDWTYDFGTD